MNMLKYIPFTLWGLFFVYEELWLRILNGTGFFGGLLYPVFFGISMGLLLNGLTIWLKDRSARIVNLILLSGTGILFITECLVKKTYQKYMTLSAIVSGADGVAGHYTKELVGTIFGGLLAIIVFLLPALLYWKYGKKLSFSCKDRFEMFLNTMVAGLAVFGIAYTCVSLGGATNQYTTMFEFDTGTETFGLLTSLRLSMIRDEGSFSVVDATEISEEPEEPEPEEIVYEDNVMDLNLDELIANDSEGYRALDEYVNSLTPSKQNEYTGIFKDKNLILICAEAFSGAVVSEELTPTLYRMIHEGFYFSDFFQCTWGGSTISGEYSFLTGLVPTNGTESIEKTVGKNEYFTLPNQMQRLGYHTGAYHNGSYTFYNRDKTHMNLGFDFWMAQGNGLEELTGKDPTDEEMISATFDTYFEETPFCMYYMTVTGHSPYEPGIPAASENWEYVKSIIGDGYSDTVTAYYCYQYELEKAMATLLQKLEGAGLAEDTVICLCPDHYPYGLSKGAYNNPVDYYEEVVGGEINTNVDMDHNSMILWSKCLEKGGDLHEYQREIPEVTYSLDIVPTLSNLFGLEFDSRLFAGRDVLAEETEAVILWNSYSWYNEKGYYNSRRGEFIPNGEMPDQSYIDRMCEIVKNKINFSKQVVELDYYGHLFGADEQ